MRMSEVGMRASSPMLLFLLSLVMASFLDTTAGQIGVCYGENGNNLPSNSEAVALYKQYNIQRMRMYGPNPNALNALRGSNIELILDVPNGDLVGIANSQTTANTWVQNNVKNYQGVRFKYISVGNEVKPEYTAGQGAILIQAMQNIDKALSEAGLRIPVSTTTFMGAFTDTYPPSKGRFSNEYLNFLRPVIGFLASKRYPLLVNIYTYFGYLDPNSGISLEFALFKPDPGFNDPSNQYHYENLFHANIDSVYSALEKLGGGSLDVVVSESGWPTQGGRGASVANAEAYINNLINYVRNGSPKRPGKPIETYLFAMFDENRKATSPNDEFENYWGMFNPTSRQLKYGVKFN